MRDPDDMSALFPVDGARQLLDVIGNSASEVREFEEDVRESVIRVREMLGDFGRLAQAAAVWNEHTVACADAAGALVDAAGPRLVADWGGTAADAYRAHHAEVRARMRDTAEQAHELARVIQEVRDTVAAEYQVAVTSLVDAIGGVLVLAGGVGGGVRGPVAAARAIEVLRTFLTAVGSALGRTVEQLVAHTDGLSRLRRVLAELPAPRPAAEAAPELGQPDRWTLIPGPAVERPAPD